ncbi:DUF4344 domain-containing metallopeptidase [Vibrio fluvialis]|nr:DUF4344 domain-containing metallopeptidase [Vibrio fluvialis]MBL4289209.1 DUF4344 domain-containing metallopeptidase [Vibrio fluvialis]MBL4293550.1 DUF4344 domain-containing metallopeptidase [Vibrio fluvialis]MBY7847577.1 DUF4344 domain-containing metallopeptidase [Vibrio fluvialis]MBY7933726.1 DUF4344 domain-containing metallopeptidase [Vibrio fluvialis]
MLFWHLDKKTDMKILVALLITCFSVPSALAKSNIRIECSPPQSKEEQQTVQDINDSGVNKIVVALSDSLFPFDDLLKIHYGENEGPLYDPENHVISIPYTFYNEALNYFQKNGYAEKYGRSVKEGASDTLLHTLLHEIGHAYIADKSIPILGKEEDAVDNFATIILLDYVDDGSEIAISAADMFAFESEERPEYYQPVEYIDEHSFDLQRYFSTLCLVYGSNPKEYAYLLDEVGKDYLKDRKEFCIDNYQQINNNWHTYLSVRKP